MLRIRLVISVIVITCFLMVVGVLASHQEKAEAADGSYSTSSCGVVIDNLLQRFESQVTAPSKLPVHEEGAIVFAQAVQDIQTFTDPHGDNEGLAEDLEALAVGYDPVASEYAFLVGFYAPFYGLGSRHSVLINLDTDRNPDTGLGWGSRGLGSDYTIIMSGSDSGWTANLWRTPSSNSSTWGLVSSLQGLQNTADDAILVVVPDSYLGSPLSFNILTSSTYQVYNNYYDYLPNSGYSTYSRTPVTPPTTSPSTQFSDVFSNTAEDHDYPDAVYALAGQGVINGFPDGTFRPDDPVIRQQFAKMIVKLLGLQVTGTEVCPFVDVVKGGTGSDPCYPDKYVAVCAACGITRGKTATLFDPYANITRAQVLTMVVRAADNQAPGTLSAVPGNWSGWPGAWPYYDDPNHGANVKKAEYNKLLAGVWTDTIDTMNLYRNASRGEVAQILWQLQQKLPGGAPAPGESLVFSDDFSEPRSGWPNDQSWSGNRYLRYENGRYVIQYKAGFSGTFWAGPSLSDARVEADMELLEGDTDACCGLILRLQDGDNYYLFEFGDGWYSTWLHEQGNWTPIKARTISSAIARIGGLNHVEFAASGSTFTGRVNSTLLFTAEDSHIARGQIGFRVEASNTHSVTARIDNLKVWSK